MNKKESKIIDEFVRRICFSDDRFKAPEGLVKGYTDTEDRLVEYTCIPMMNVINEIKVMVRALRKENEDEKQDSYKGTLQ